MPTTIQHLLPLAVAALADENDNRLATIHQHPTSPSDELSRPDTTAVNRTISCGITGFRKEYRSIDTSEGAVCRTLSHIIIILEAEGS